MAISDEEIEHVRELFAGLEPLTIKRMFGGTGIYSNGQIFAIQGSEGGIFLKARGTFSEELRAAGSTKFEVVMKGELRSMGYMSLPDEALDDPELACEWAMKAIAAIEEDHG